MVSRPTSDVEVVAATVSSHRATRGNSRAEVPPAQARDEITGARVFVFLFDFEANLWLQERLLGQREVLDISASTSVRPGEIAAEAAYRAQFDATGFNCPLDEVETVIEEFIDTRGAVGRAKSTVFIGFTDQIPAPGRSVRRFVALRVDRVMEQLEGAPAVFAPGFDEFIRRGRTALEARQAELREAARRHPAAGWRARPRERAQVAAPHTVDLRLVGLCQLRCAWCWGPEHIRTGSVNPDEWSALLAQLGLLGTRQVIFSGGEPTLSSALRPCIQTAKSQGMAVTLSTNAIRLAAFEDVIPLLDDIGIPVDGSSEAMNDRMRERSRQHDAWSKAIDGLRLVELLRAEGRTSALVTIRTVVARPNLRDVPDIPAALMSRGVRLDNTRLKLYQVEPFGPHVANIDFDGEWAVAPAEVTEVARLMTSRYPCVSIELQLYSKTVGRYFLVDPDGWATGTDEDPDGRPIEVHYGNLVRDFDNTLARYRAHQGTLAGSERTEGEA